MSSSLKVNYALHCHLLYDLFESHELKNTRIIARFLLHSEQKKKERYPILVTIPTILLILIWAQFHQFHS